MFLEEFHSSQVCSVYLKTFRSGSVTHRASFLEILALILQDISRWHCVRKHSRVLHSSAGCGLRAIGYSTHFRVFAALKVHMEGMLFKEIL